MQRHLESSHDDSRTRRAVARRCQTFRTRTRGHRLERTTRTDNSCGYATAVWGIAIALSCSQSCSIAANRRPRSMSLCKAGILDLLEEAPRTALECHALITHDMACCRGRGSDIAVITRARSSNSIRGGAVRPSEHPYTEGAFGARCRLEGECVSGMAALPQSRAARRICSPRRHPCRFGGPRGVFRGGPPRLP